VFLLALHTTAGGPEKQGPVVNRWPPLPLFSATISPMVSGEERAEKTRAVAAALFPGEEWVATEAGVWVAKSRLSERERERDKWEKEMAQVRILTSRGSVAYFLPERDMGARERRCADMVLDGVVMEMKTVTGSRSALGWEFQQGYKQGKALFQNRAAGSEHSVFVRLLPDLPVASVKAKIAGELKERHDNGEFICFFERSGDLYTWSYAELRAFIRSDKK